MGSSAGSSLNSSRVFANNDDRFRTGHLGRQPRATWFDSPLRCRVGCMKPRQRVSALTMLAPVLMGVAMWFTLMSNPSSGRAIAAVAVACLSFALFVWALVRYVKDHRRFG